MAGALKKSTMLTGLEVAKFPHRELNIIYRKILNALRNYPADSAYRIHTEKLVKERSEIVQNVADISAMEEKIGAGQIEEVIIQAQNELKVASKLHEWKPWVGETIQPPQNQWAWPPHQ